MRSTAILTELSLALLLSSCGDDDVPLPYVDAGPDAGWGDAGSCVAGRADYPEPVAGACEARVVDDAATLPVGDDGAGGFIVPGARRLTRVGTVVQLPGFPMSVLPVPGTRRAVVSDGGIGDDLLSVVDIDTATVVDQEAFRDADPDSEGLFLGLALSSDGRRLWASGGGSDRIYAFDLDPATGQITRATARDITVADTPADGYVSGIRLLSDDRTLAAALLLGDQLVLYDTSDGSESARIPLGDATYPYDLVVTPDDATAYVSLWNASAVVPVDLTRRTLGALIPVGKNPEGLALSPDASRLVVAGSDSDSLSVIDVATGVSLDTLWVAGETAARGASPTAGTFDASGRLYVVNAGDNAVDVFDPVGSSYTRVGRIPTMWYPTDVATLDDGTLLILNGKDEGTGPNLAPGTTDILDLLGGSLTVLAPGEVSDGQLAGWEVDVGANNTRARGFQRVDCPGGEYDFPVPRPGEGPSRVIEHVVILIRENKTYDAYLGNLTAADGSPYGNGDPTLTLLPPDEVESVLPNTWALARQFAMGDNYYSLAEQSIQGHFWTTHGRTTDFVERSWLSTWGRAYWPIPPQGIIEPLGYAEEGSLFDYLVDHGVDLANYGEIVSSRAASPEPTYPGLIYNMGVHDVDKARFLAAEWRDRCRLRTFSYIVMPNDHTYGLKPGRPTPRSMIADNDEGVGRVAEALSHSSWWPSTVLFVIEDDPQDGGDHVDNHRSPLLVISPWVKHHHVSTVHYNESSIYRTVQLILGIDTPLNAYWDNASPMYEMFSSTPDYAPYDHIDRRWPEGTNPDDGSSMAAISQAWDFSEPDVQPGLSHLLYRYLRGGDAPWPGHAELRRSHLGDGASDRD